MSIFDGVQEQSWNVDGTITDEMSFRIFGADGVEESPDWRLEWRVRGNLGPSWSILQRATLTNLDSEIRTYVITATLSIDEPVSPASLMRGAISRYEVDDLNGGGAVWGASAPGTPTYAALIDGDVFQELAPFPHQIVAPPGGRASWVSVGNEYLTFPVGHDTFVTGPPVNSTLAVRLAFTLTPGDRVLVPASFSAVTVPEPKSVALAAAMASLVIAIRRAGIPTHGNITGIDSQGRGGYATTLSHPGG
jgi:hypothetical protein